MKKTVQEKSDKKSRYMNFNCEKTVQEKSDTKIDT
jgi:hypothetical protein